MLTNSQPSFSLSSTILDSLIEEVAIIDDCGTLVHANAAWVAASRSHRCVSSVATGGNYLAGLRAAAPANPDAAHILEGVERVLAGSTDLFEHEYACPSKDDIRWFAQRVSPLRSAAGVLITRIDITDRKRAEKEREAHRFELGRAVRAATLGQLSGALAHELNQPISAILTNAQVGLAMRAQGRTGELFDILEDIEHDARRTGALVARLRRMLERRNERMELTNVNNVIEEALTLCKSELIARRIDVSTRLEGGLPPVHGDPIALEHLLLNVIVNAYEAMSLFGAVTRELELATETVRDGRIRVTVLDSGPGVDESTTARLFEPLYTTKEGGLGLGLSICRSIVDAHHGDIALSRGPNGGVLVEIELPAAGSSS